VRTDVLRKRHFGRAPEERLPPEAYAPEVSREIYGASLGLAEAALGAGQGVVLDAVFARAAEREAAADVAARAGVPFRGIWLTAPLGVRVARIGGRAVDASDADAAVAVAQEAFETGALGAWRSVDADAPPDMVLDRVRAALG
jgi:predicted kinase